MTLGDVWRPPKPFGAGVPEVQPFHALVRWDGGWYGEIAQNGYWIAPGQQSPVAYFPLYPLLVRALGLLGIGRWFAGPLISFAAGVAALLLFARWASRVKPGVGAAAMPLLLLWPFAEYLFGVMYSDALFLALALGAFTALEEDHPVLATLLGALATATRPVAPGLVLGLVVRSLERRRLAGAPLRFVDVLPAAAGLGLAAYMAFLFVKFGDPLAFAHVQGAPGWDQPPGWEAWLKVWWFKELFPRSAPLVAIRLVGHALATLGGLALIVPTFKRLGLGYGVYVLIVLGLPALASKDFHSLGRYLMAAFPLFLTFATVLEPRPKLRAAWLVASGLALAALSVALGMGGYVA